MMSQLLELLPVLVRLVRRGWITSVSFSFYAESDRS